MLPPATSWFPKWNPSGTTYKGSVAWLDDTTFVYNDGAGLSRSDGKKLTSTSASEFAAGGGEWIVSNTKKIETSTGLVVEGAAAPAMNSQGRFVYLFPSQQNTKGLYLDGKRLYTGLHVAEPSISTQLLVWRTSGGKTLSYRLDRDGAVVQEEPTLRVARYRPIAIDTPEGPFILNHTETGHCIVKAGTTLGWFTDTNEQSYNPDGIYRDGAIRVVCTTSKGAPAVYNYPLSSTRLDLKKELPPPVPPVDYLSIVKKYRAAYDSRPASKQRGWLISNATAWELRKQGINAGLLQKPSPRDGTYEFDGKSFAVDIVVIDFKHYDCLGDGEGRAVPGWADKGPLQSGWRLALPYDPARFDDTPPPPPPDLLSIPREELESIIARLSSFL